MADVDPRLVHLLAGLSDMGEQPMPMQPSADPRLAQALVAGGEHDEVLEMVQRAERAEKFRKAFGIEHDAPDFQQQLLSGARDKSVPYAATSIGAQFAGANPLAALLAAGTATLWPTPAHGQDVEIVKQLQRRLKESGDYQGPIDGQMGDLTQKAKRAFDAREVRNQQQAIERQKADAAAKAFEADTARAQAETARAKTEAEKIAFEKSETERKTREREEGSRKLQEREDSLPWYDRIYRDYGTPLAVALGIGSGYLFKRGVVNRSDARSRDLADRGDQLMRGAPPAGTPVTQQNLPGRAGRVNEFWAEGQHQLPLRPPVEQPFNRDTGAPRGWAPNPNAPQAAQLYQPNTARNIATDIAAPAGFGVESLASGFMEGRAQKRLAAASDAYDNNPTETNLRNLQKAKEDVAFWGALETVGRAGALTYLAKGGITQRTNTRPHTGTADAERNAIDVYLRRYGGGGQNAGGPNPAPPLVQPSALPAGHWNRQNRAPAGQAGGGRFSGGFVDD